MDFEKIILTILYFHQTLDIVGVKGYVIRPKTISIDTIGWLLLTLLMVLYYLGVSFINVILIVLFGLALYGFYYFHWKLFFLVLLKKNKRI